MKKQNQLGMNPSTAAHRLRMDVLFSLVKNTPCYHCGGVLTRETFSIEHKTPWLDSDDPVGLFFNLDNISFSHQSCNAGNRRVPNKVYASVRERDTAKQRRRYTPERRRARYERTGH